MSGQPVNDSDGGWRTGTPSINTIGTKERKQHPKKVEEKPNSELPLLCVCMWCMPGAKLSKARQPRIGHRFEDDAYCVCREEKCLKRAGDQPRDAAWARVTNLSRNVDTQLLSKIQI